jgi:hypothetical protein
VNRRDLEKKLSPITSGLLREKGYISLIDVFIGLGYLTKKDVESWRMKRIPYLEKSVKVGLSKITFIIKTVRENCRKGGLRESYTAYKSWGKGAKVDLQFSKSGAKNIEALYSTHWLKGCCPLLM